MILYRRITLSDMDVLQLEDAIEETKQRLASNRLLTSIGGDNYLKDVQTLWALETQSRRKNGKTTG